MAKFTVKVTVTYPVAPKVFNQKLRHEWLNSMRLLYVVAVLCKAEGVSVELLDSSHERIGDIGDIINNLETTNWPARFQKKATINLSERAMLLLQQIQKELSLAYFDSILSAAAHLAWMTYDATWIRLTKQDGTVTTIKMSDFKEE